MRRSGGGLKDGGANGHLAAAPLAPVVGQRIAPPPSQRLASTDALLCRFFAAVSLQVLRWLSDPVEKLRLRVVERMTKGGESVRVAAVVTGVRGAFKCAVSHLGELALDLLFLCCCVAPGDALALRPGSAAADTRG